MSRIVMAALMMLAMLSSARADDSGIIFQEKSLYRNIYVYEENGLRCIRFLLNKSTGRQSCVTLADPRILALNYTKMMMGALFLNPAPKTILVIGLGGGTLPTTLHRILPDATITSVEIDSAILHVAERFFAYREDDKMTSAIEDGRVFVRRMQRQHRHYDLIMLDAYNQEYIPEHMLTREFLEEVDAILADGGVLAANTFSFNRLYDHESVTYATVFGGFYNLKLNNRVILLRKGGLPAMAEIRDNAARVNDALLSMGLTQDWLLTLFKTEPDWDPKARILTDEYSPSNLLNGTTR